MPVIFGFVIGGSCNIQQRNAANMGERLSPRRGSIGWVTGGGAAFAACGVVSDWMPGTIGLLVNL